MDLEREPDRFGILTQKGIEMTKTKLVNKLVSLTLTQDNFIRHAAALLGEPQTVMIRRFLELGMEEYAQQAKKSNLNPSKAYLTKPRKPDTLVNPYPGNSINLSSQSKYQGDYKGGDRQPGVERDDKLRKETGGGLPPELSAVADRFWLSRKDPVHNFIFYQYSDSGELNKELAILTLINHTWDKLERLCDIIANSSVEIKNTEAYFAVSLSKPGAAKLPKKRQEFINYIIDELKELPEDHVWTIMKDDVFATPFTEVRR